MKKVLITGASGFVGGFLAEYLLSLKTYEIFGTYHSDTNLQQSPVKDTVQFRKVDFLNAEEVANLLQKLRRTISDFNMHCHISYRLSVFDHLIISVQGKHLNLLHQNLPNKLH